MKRQIIALLTGAALLATPLMSQLATAQTTGNTAATPSGSLSRRLNLTDAQKAQLKALRAETMAQIRAVLTPVQQTQFDAARAAQKAERAAHRADRAKGIATETAPGRPNILQSLNLTAAQKAQIKQIRAAAKPRMDAVYTDRQRAQLAEFKAARQARKLLQFKG